MFVEGKSRTVFFPSDTLIYGISRDGFKKFNKCTRELLILGQLRMRARQTKNAPLLIGSSEGVSCCNCYYWLQDFSFDFNKF